MRQNFIFYKIKAQASIPANSVRLGRGYLFVQPMEAFKNCLKTIIIFDASSTETTKKGAKMQQKREKIVISHLTSASPWNELDLTLKNNEI